MKEIIAHLVYPSPLLIFGFMFMIFFDLLTGIRKASKNGEATTSRGLRNTIDKTGSYITLILSVLIIINITAVSDSAENFVNLFHYSINGLVIGCTYIELKSILENLILINTDKSGKKTDLCVYFLIPMHGILIMNLNKFKKQEDEK